MVFLQPFFVILHFEVLCSLTSPTQSPSASYKNLPSLQQLFLSSSPDNIIIQAPVLHSSNSFMFGKALPGGSIASMHMALKLPGVYESPPGGLVTCTIQAQPQEIPVIKFEKRPRTHLINRLQVILISVFFLSNSEMLSQYTLLIHINDFDI